MSVRESPREIGAAETAHSLEVYAIPGCPGWHRATALATMVLTAGIPGVRVRIVDRSRPGTSVPDCVVASPTWILNGRRLVFGNPDPDWLLARLDALDDERSELRGRSART